MLYFPRLNDRVPVKMNTAKLQYKQHQVPKPKSLSFRLAVLFAQSIEARC